MQYEPMFLKAKRILQAGGIGKVAAIEGATKVDESSPAEKNQLRLEAEHLATALKREAGVRKLL